MLYTLPLMPRKFHRRRHVVHGRKLNKRQIGEVKRILNGKIETKYDDDLPSSSYTQLDRVFTGYAGNRLTTLPQSAAQSARVGDRVQLKSIELRYVIYYAGSGISINSQHLARVTLVEWRTDDAVSPCTVSQVFQFPSSGVGKYEPTVTCFNYENLKNGTFRVVYDKIHSLGFQSAGVHVHRKIKLRNAIEFDTASGAPNNFGTGHIYMFVCADDEPGAHVPSLQFMNMTRLLYTDS